ncbi:MAG: pyridoxamine 5'-phosphate oxidase family protein [Candidatus Paceibacterota bacterium]|jgi:general stress protein 26
MFTEKATEKIKKEAKEYLQSEKLAVLSTVSPEGKPQSATVLYLFDDDYNFFFVTRNDTQKAENLSTNNNVSIVVGAQLGPVTMQMSGAAILLSPIEQKEFIYKLSKNAELKQLYYGPFLNLEGINFSLYRVAITWARWLKIDIEKKKEVYYQIIP